MKPTKIVFNYPFKEKYNLCHMYKLASPPDGTTKQRNVETQAINNAQQTDSS